MAGSLPSDRGSLCRNSPDQTVLCLTQCPYHLLMPLAFRRDRGSYRDFRTASTSTLGARCTEGTMDGPGSSDSSSNSTMGLTVKETNSH
ncbi:unnamed protein product [Arctogadus glacialis]